jgi:hypothetical protein
MPAIGASSTMAANRERPAAPARTTRTAESGDCAVGVREWVQRERPSPDTPSPHRHLHAVPRQRLGRAWSRAAQPPRASDTLAAIGVVGRPMSLPSWRLSSKRAPFPAPASESASSAA